MINAMKILAFAAAKLRGMFKINETGVAEWEPADVEGTVMVYDRPSVQPVGKPILYGEYASRYDMDGNLRPGKDAVQP